MTIRQEYICAMPGCPSKVVAKELPEHWGCFDALGTQSHFCSIQCAQSFVNEWVKGHEELLGVMGGHTVGTVFTCDGCSTEILLKPGEAWPYWVEIKIESAPFRKGFCSADCLGAYLGSRCVDE